MRNRMQALIVAVVAAAVGMMLTSNGPIGRMLWPMPAETTPPDSGQLPFLLGLDLIQPAAFGVGVAFLAFGYPIVARLATHRRFYAAAVYIAVAWGLVNWVPHIALHQTMGDISSPGKIWALIGVDYAFHLTAVAAGLLVLHFVLGLGRAQSHVEPGKDVAPSPLPGALLSTPSRPRRASR